MAPSVQTQPVEDSVPKINDELAVGADLEFQTRWWRFERIAWAFFFLLIVLDGLGLFGRGYLAKAQMTTGDNKLSIQYERVERFRTPSILTIELGPQAVHDGKVELWISRTLVRPLGNQRIIPQPATSIVGEDGITYTFPAEPHSAVIEFALEPGSTGIYDLAVGIPGSERLQAKILVVP